MKKNKSLNNKRKRRHDSKSPHAGDLLNNMGNQRSRFEWLCMSVLLMAGIYLSIVYFGQKAVPNSDFTAFVQTGREVLHFQVPSSFKRVPILGILQIIISKFVPASPHPILTGALALNSILYTFSVLLFYKTCRYFLEPTASFCLSLIAILNPWSISMLVDPIAETTIVFFIMLTFYLIFRGSRWCYLAAMLASMTRYECFGMIGIALLFDLFKGRGTKQKLTALGMAFAASIPMVLWVIGTKMSKMEAGGHYFRVFLDVEHRNGFKLLEMLWKTSFSSLLEWPEWIYANLVEKPSTRQTAEAIQLNAMRFQTAWNVITGTLFILGLVWGYVKKQWQLLGLLLFWGGYVCIHMSQNVLLDRYTVPVIWLTLLISAYGLVCSGDWLKRYLPKAAGYGFVLIGALIAICWTMRLWPAISKTAAVSPASSNVAYVALLLALIALAGKQLTFRRKSIILSVCLFCAMGLMIVSNQFMLSFRLGRGDLDIEFRKTAEWYLENANNREKLVTTLPGVVNLFLPEGRKNAIHSNRIPGENIAEFADNCRSQSIKYVAWDSRLGFAVRDVYYEMWGLKKVHPLGSGKDIGPFKFIQKIEGNSRRYIHLYRLDFDEMPADSN